MTLYEKFLDDNGLEEGMYHGNASLLFKKDGSDAWTDPVTGKGFKALSNDLFFEKAYNAGVDSSIKEISSCKWNVNSTEPKILFSLTMSELVELLKNQPDSALKDRLKTAQTTWEDFINSKEAEEEGN